jgi:hypothetical protein
MAPGWGFVEDSTSVWNELLTLLLTILTLQVGMSSSRFVVPIGDRFLWKFMWSLALVGKVGSGL